MTVIKLAFEDLSEDLIDIVRVTAVHSDIESLAILFDLEIEWNLLDDLFLVENEELRELLPVLVLG